MFYRTQSLCLGLRAVTWKSICILFILSFFHIGCRESKRETLIKEEIVIDRKEINSYVVRNLEDALESALDSAGTINDSLHLEYYKVTAAYYASNQYAPVWSDTGTWRPIAAAFIQYLDTCIYDGLFKADYRSDVLSGIYETLKFDSAAMRDAVQWTKADLILTSAFMHVLGDLKQGRLHADSSSWQHDSARHKKYFFPAFNEFRKGVSMSDIAARLQPAHLDFVELKAGVRRFVDSMDNRDYTVIGYPFKRQDVNDSLRFIKELWQRLHEADSLTPGKSLPDSIALAIQIRRYQKKAGLTVDGNASLSLVRRLNFTDKEKLLRIAITLDRYKQLPDSLPKQYVWVNLPAYQMKVVDSDTVAFYSKIICGKPGTPTPLLTGMISDMVIYPTWTVPQSIIKKEMLPALRKNSGYLAKKGLNLYTLTGEPVDPYTVNWTKYSKGIPYKIQQGSGDDNALGVIKFNFKNPYDVYLHDTNQRYLFKKSSRALSHGCVRVQDWEKLAFFLVRNDSIKKLPDTLAYTTDSITSWIAAKQKHRVNVLNPLPLFIRYYSCEAKDGKVRFYEDIYSEDKKLREKYFAKQ